MGYYVVRRIVAMFLTLIALSILVFLLFAALPVNPAALTCGKSCTPEVIHANEVRLGYDKPLYVQYGTFVKGVFAGRTYGSGTATFECPAPCLGYSFARGENVTHLIAKRLPVTATEAVGACVLWLGVGVVVGVVAALRRGRWQDRVSMSGALIGYSFPTFFIGLVLLYLVVFKLRIMAYPSYTPFSDDPVAWFKSFILPWATLAAVFAAFYARLTRNQMLDTLGEDYIRTARAKGLKRGKVIFKHALRASLTPIVTATGVDLGQLLGGVVITETIFALPGLGKLALQSVTSADLPVITAVVLVAASFIIVANLVVDLLYGLIDPRVRVGE
ncbi:MAG: ABC transporter permease [Streptosporangiales bacterium]